MSRKWFSRRRPRTGRGLSVRPEVVALEDRTAPAILFQPSNYHTIDFGGPVIQHVDVDLILWGTAWNTPANQQLANALRRAVTSIVTGPYLSDLAQYRGIGPGTLARVDAIADNRLPARFTINDARAVLQQGITTGLLPDPRTDPQRLYFVVPPPGSHFHPFGGLGEAGGFHNYDISPLDGITHYRYGLEADHQDQRHGINSNLEYLTTFFSHELVEAVSDPEPPTAPAFQLAPGGGNKELCDNDAELYTYRIDNFQYRVEPYWSDRAGSYIVPTGDTQNFVIDNAVSRTLYVLGDQLANVNDQITLDKTPAGGVKVTLNGTVAQFNRHAIRGVIVSPRTGANTVTVVASASNVPIHVKFLAGNSDRLNVGAPGNGRLDNLGLVWVAGHLENVDLVFNDQANPNAGDTYILDKGTFSLTRGTGRVAFFRYRQVHSLTLNTGPQNKTVIVKSTDPNTPTTVNLNAGNVTLNLGDPARRHLDGLRGPLTVHSQNAVVDATASDQGNHRNGQVYTLTAPQLTRTGGVTVNFDTLRSLTLNAGAGNNTVTVAGTAANTTTNINMTTGTLNLGSPGNGMLDNLRGRVNYTSRPNAVDLVFNEQGNVNADTYTVTNASLARARNGLLYTYNQVRSVTLNLGTGNNTVQLQSAVAGTTLRGGAGNNTVVVQGVISTADVTLTNIQVVQVNGGTLNVVNNVGVRDVRVTAGSLNVRAGTLTATGTFTQTAGTTTISAGAAVTAAGGAAIQGGTLNGGGRLNADVTNGAQLNPGDLGTIGIFTINGDYTQIQTGALNIDIGGRAGDQFDQLQVSGRVTLDGTLNVRLINGYNPNLGDSFQILTFATSSGGFQMANGLALGGNRFFHLRYDVASLTLVVDTEYPSVGGQPYALAVGDFNGDGIPDLVVSSSQPNQGSVSVLLGNGDGSFRPARAFATGSPLLPYSVAVGDFNGDGRLDIAVASCCDPFAFGGTVSVLLGNGDGTFQPARNFNPVGSSIAVVVADVNGDSKPDLVVANSGLHGRNGNIGVLLGNGDGTFQPTRFFATATGYLAEGVAVGDFNSDGIPDLAVIEAQPFNPGNVSVLLGNGDGSFRPARAFAAGVSPAAVVVGDFNGDGIADLAVANRGNLTGNGQGVSVLLGNGDGSFQPLQFTGIGGGYLAISALAAGDLNGDGILDLAVAGNAVSLLLGSGAGTFQVATNYPTGATAIAIADLNGDGRLDLAVVNGPRNSVAVLLNTGPGTQPRTRGSERRAPATPAGGGFPSAGLPARPLDPAEPIGAPRQAAPAGRPIMLRGEVFATADPAAPWSLMPAWTRHPSTTPDDVVIDWRADVELMDLIT